MEAEILASQGNDRDVDAPQATEPIQGNTTPSLPFPDMSVPIYSGPSTTAPKGNRRRPRTRPVFSDSPAQVKAQSTSTDLETAVVKHMDFVREQMGSKSSNSNDDDQMFALSIVPYMKRLPDSDKLSTRIKILSVLQSATENVAARKAQANLRSATVTTVPEQNPVLSQPGYGSYQASIVNSSQQLQNQSFASGSQSVAFQSVLGQPGETYTTLQNVPFDNI
jgi:hypothetical protein